MKRSGDKPKQEKEHKGKKHVPKNSNPGTRRIGRFTIGLT